LPDSLPHLPRRFSAAGSYDDLMLYTIAVILIILWLLGFIAHVGGGLIHLILVIAVILIIVNLVTGRRP
jgi:hypothetical protein